MALSTTVSNEIATYVCIGTAPTRTTTRMMSLHTGDPGTTGANEVAGGSYARQTAGYAAASGGACALTGAVSFTSMPAATVTHIGIWDSGTPTFFLGAALTSSQAVGAGNTLSITSATITVAAS